MCSFCNRGSSSSAAFQQHHPPDPWKWSLFGRQDCASRTTEAQTWSSRPSYRRRTAKCGEPFGWAGNLCALTNVSNESLKQGLLHHHHHPVVSVKLVWVSFTSSRPTPLAVPDGQAGAPEETLTQQQARMSASSATRELDELMASLSDFKVQSNVSRVQWYGSTCDWCY